MVSITEALTLLIAADETVARRQGRRAGAAAPGLRPDDREAGQGRRDRGGERGSPRLFRSTCRARWTGRSGIAAAAHAAQALPFAGPAAGLAHGLATQLLFKSTVAATGPTLDGPLLSVPDGPGLGVEIDDDALAAHRI